MGTQKVSSKAANRMAIKSIDRHGKHPKPSIKNLTKSSVKSLQGALGSQSSSSQSSMKSSMIEESGDMKKIKKTGSGTKKAGSAAKMPPQTASKSTTKAKGTAGVNSQSKVFVSSDEVSKSSSKAKALANSLSSFNKKGSGSSRLGSGSNGLGGGGETVCREVACEGLTTSGGYCRLHYIKNWKKIKRKETILREKKLNQYIEELVAKYPDKYIEAIRQDLENDKDFAKVIYDLDLDEGVDDFDVDGVDSADSLIDTIKRDFDDDGDAF